MKGSMVLFAAAALSPMLFAQDSRTVTEPVMPPACVTLDAQLTRAGKTLAPEDEKKLDTKRIQEAMDKCGKGKGCGAACERRGECVS